MDDRDLNIKEQYRLYDPIPPDKQNGIVEALDGLGRQVVIKYLRVPGVTPKEREKNASRALGEARAMVDAEKLRMNIPRIHQAYYDKGRNMVYVIMDKIVGRTLREEMRLEEPQPAVFLGWMKELCDILAGMENLSPRLYHKDVKPENIIISFRNPKKKQGELWLIDFNISLSLPNHVEGTASYRAPETEKKASQALIAGRDKSDMFSIGAMMYEYYSGHIPVKGIDYGGIVRKKNSWEKFNAPVWKETLGMPDGRVNAVIRKCMSLEPKDRYANYRELGRAIGECQKKKKS